MPFEYQKNELCLIQAGKKHNLFELAQKQGTPFYVYDLEGMVKRLKFFQKHTPPGGLHYAMKANSHPEILKAFAKAGSGVDVVSGGEIKLALQAGFKGKDMVFSGVGKTEAEIRLGIETDILQFNVESLPELQVLAQISRDMNKKARVAFRINPNVEEIDTHPYIKTGMREHKFGLEVSLLPKLKEILKKYPDSVSLHGLTMHIGSQMQDLGALKEACLKIQLLYQEMTGEFDLKTLDVGGGLGISYKEENLEQELGFIQEYGEFLQSLNIKGRLLTEPGRIITARFGLLIAQVLYIKRTSFKNFAILDTGMHHLIRPCLYQAYHRILPLKKDKGYAELYDVVGPICESSDVLGRDRSFENLKRGDFVAILDTGAYGACMASRYNTHNLAEELVFN